MIEVEKKFKPNEEQLNAMIANAEFLGEKVLHDVYYDYPDYRMFKANIRFRNRDGNFELKLGKRSGVAEEIEKIEEIKKYFNTELELVEFIDKNLIPFIDYNTKRRKYKKENFTIDIDEMSYGYSMVEIELLVDEDSQIKDAEEKIINFAKSYNFEQVDGLAKRNMYLKTVRPELYQELCVDN